MENDKRFNGKAIYNPKNKAAEYSVWACNFFTGCSNECEYCYCRKGLLGRLWSAKPQLKKCFKNVEHALDIFCNEVDKNEEELKKHGLLFSFTTDPMLKETKDLTWASVIYATSSGIPVKILTKRADIFDLSLETFPLKDKVAFGFTITGHDELEPNASTNAERIEAMKKLHKAGFKTWASIEPIIDFDSSFEMIEKTIGFCDLYKIGLMSGKKYETNVLGSFIQRVNKACMFGTTDTYKPKIYWKNSITDITGKYMIESGFNVDRNYNLFQ